MRHRKPHHYRRCGTALLTIVATGALRARAKKSKNLSDKLDHDSVTRATHAGRKTHDRQPRDRGAVAEVVDLCPVSTDIPSKPGSLASLRGRGDQQLAPVVDRLDLDPTPQQPASAHVNDRQHGLEGWVEGESRRGEPPRSRGGGRNHGVLREQARLQLPGEELEDLN